MRFDGKSVSQHALLVATDLGPRAITVRGAAKLSARAPDARRFVTIGVGLAVWIHADRHGARLFCGTVESVDAPRGRVHALARNAHFTVGTALVRITPGDRTLALCA